MKVNYSDENGSRGRKSIALVVDPQGRPAMFDTFPEPEGCRIMSDKYIKCGKWSHSEFVLEIADGFSFLEWREDFDNGLAFPQNTWGEVSTFFETRIGRPVDMTAVRALVQNKWPDEFKRIEENEAALKPAASTTIVVTRHTGLVQWLTARGITGQVIAQVNDPAEIAGRVVVGALPLHLAAVAAEVVAVDMPGLRPDQRGKDLTPAEMDEAGASLSRYVVRKI